MALAAGQIPTPPQIVAFNIFGSFVDLAGNIALAPLLFDYVPRNRMGTIYSGMTFVRGLVKVTVVNGVGLWVKTYSWIVCEPGTYDYSSGLLYIFAIGVFGLVCCQYFLAQRRKGLVVEYGRQDLEGRGNLAVD